MSRMLTLSDIYKPVGPQEYAQAIGAIGTATDIIDKQEKRLAYQQVAEETKNMKIDEITGTTTYTDYEGEQVEIPVKKERDATWYERGMKQAELLIKKGQTAEGLQRQRELVAIDTQQKANQIAKTQLILNTANTLTAGLIDTRRKGGEGAARQFIDMINKGAENNELLREITGGKPVKYEDFKFGKNELALHSVQGSKTGLLIYGQDIIGTVPLTSWEDKTFDNFVDKEKKAGKGDIEIFKDLVKFKAELKEEGLTPIEKEEKKANIQLKKAQAYKATKIGDIAGTTQDSKVKQQAWDKLLKVNTELDKTIKENKHDSTPATKKAEQKNRTLFNMAVQEYVDAGGNADDVKKLMQGVDPLTNSSIEFKGKSGTSQTKPLSGY